ncbi:MAG: Phosphate transport system substrate-binding protein [Lacunisphaera sp.]|nr:Phosphate transport system substrate-binding protein [Lacunisphaera sp.]
MLLALVTLPSLAAEPAPSRVLRLAGNPEMSGVVARWSAEFQKEHPAVRVETHLSGSDTGMAALYTGRADLALLGRAPTASEIQAFEWIFHYKPAQMEIMAGSLDRAGKSPALVLFVHRDNPMANLTLAQLDAIFGTEHRFAPADLRTWGQLGLTGEWADKPIHLYAPDAMSGTGRFFRHVVLNDSRMMNWAQLTEFNDSAIPRKATHDAGRQILAALAADRYGLAVASLDFAGAGVKAIALESVSATRETVLSRQYPLTRAVLACYNRKPGMPADPLVDEFLRFILSREAQQTVASETGYLPLASNLAAEQLRRLE